jgi:hypothetical protein
MRLFPMMTSKAGTNILKSRSERIFMMTSKARRWRLLKVEARKCGYPP